ncbi:hypothetical protein HanRHA438_Chr04g0167821 [Helianthus annuus]|nr:hypothetical protein HanRHA438_Chr04g0167821 [Helianthus annuus]
MESFHRRVMLPEVTSRKEYRPDRRTFPTVKFWFGRIVSVGFSNELHTTEFVEFWRIRLPESLRSAIVEVGFEAERDWPGRMTAVTVVVVVSRRMMVERRMVVVVILGF